MVLRYVCPLVVHPPWREFFRQPRGVAYGVAAGQGQVNKDPCPGSWLFFYPKVPHGVGCAATLATMKRRLVLDSYARESDRGDRRRLSVTGQHRANGERIKELGAILGEELQDQGKSAWRKSVRRPDWERMIKRLENRESDGVVIYDIERLLRRVEDALAVVKLAEKGGDGGFLIYDSGMTYDLTSVQGKETFYNAAVKAESYSHNLSKKVKRGNNTRALNGEGKPGRYRSFGFERDSTTVRESERAPIRHVANKVLHEGWTWIEAVGYLTDKEIYSTAIDHTTECVAKKEALTLYKQRSYECQCLGKPWNPRSLQRALRNPRMAGFSKSGETIGSLPGEAILTLDEWQGIIELISSRRGRPPLETGLASGVKVPTRCWQCGSSFTIQTDENVKRYSWYGDLFESSVDDLDQSRRWYKCRPSIDPDRQACSRAIADAYVLNNVLADMVALRLSSVESAEELARLQEEKREKRSPHEDEVVRLEKVRAYWDTQLNDGVDGMTPERHAAMAKEVDRKIKEAKQKLTEIGEPKEVAPVVESLESIKAKWSVAKPTRRREMLRQAFDGSHIYIMPGSTLDLEPAVLLRIRDTPRDGVLPQEGRLRHKAS